MTSRPPQQRRNAKAGAYRIVQSAGHDDTRSLYLATKGESPETYWLFESKLELGGVGETPGDNVAFTSNGKNYLALAAAGASVAQLANWIKYIEYEFIVPRWVVVAQQIGFQHSNGRVYQQAIPFDLHNILFGEDGQLAPLSFTNSASASMPFPAPEATTGQLTPASDVYSLGASLMALLGEGQPGVSALMVNRPVGQLSGHSELASVLKKAIAPDPAKRYRDANLFATALSAVVPREQLPKVKAPAKRHLPLVSFVPFICLLLLVLTVGLIWLGVYTPSSFAFLQRPTLALDTPSALPKGSLAFDLLDVNFTPDKQAHVDLRLSKGGKPVPSEAPVNFELNLDGHPIDQLNVDDAKSSSSGTDTQGVYRLSFNSSTNSGLRGNLRLTAKVIGGSLSKNVYFDYIDPSPQAASLLATDKAGLNQFSITGVQVETGRYPDLTLYFGLSGNRGAVARLHGLLVAEVSQDGQVVGDFLITPVDPVTNPVTVALAADVSGSMQGEPILKAKEAATEFVGALAAKDSACIYSFSTFISRLMTCTAERGKAVGAIESMQASGNTALYDALMVIAGDLTKLPGRKDILVLSDGADTASQAKKEEALALLKQLNVPIYTIGLTSPDFQGEVLQEFSKQTGGAFLQAPSPADLRGLYGSINSQLKNEYQLDFKSLFADRTSGNISIRLIQGSNMIETAKSFSVLNK